MPKLVVMMPAKNAEATIATAIGSALRAMPGDSELVVWDDASSDRTPEVVAAVSDPRVRLITSSQSVGSGRARSEIMRQSTSELVACMDADDFCFPWRFRAQYRHLAGCDISFGATVRFSGSGHRLRVRPSNPSRMNAQAVSTTLLFHNPLSQPTMIARRHVLESVGGYRDLPVAQDYDLWLRASTHALRLTKHALPLVAYRQTQGQISRSTDYYERVRASPQLREAYLAHVRRVNPEAFSLIREGVLPPGASTAFERSLLASARDLGPAQYSYYKKLVARQGTFLTFR